MRTIEDYLVDKIKSDPVAFSKSTTGRMFTAGYNLVPSKYDVDDYQLEDSRQPVRIVFTGMGDSKRNPQAKDAFAKRYGQNLYVFGHPQLQEAREFAASIGNRPVVVYGYSWGSNAARRFANQFQGNIKAVHFLDPMRKQMTDTPVLQLQKDIPVTYTPAGEYGEKQQVIQTLLNALRWKPSKRMSILGKVKNHGAVDQWLDELELYERKTKQGDTMNKAAYFKMMGITKSAAQQLSGLKVTKVPSTKSSIQSLRHKLTGKLGGRPAGK